MRILIDGDGFPDIPLIVELANNYKKEVIIYIDTEHEFNLDAKIIQVSKGANSVDTFIENDVMQGDLVLTQDYGVAVIALSKGAICINQLGYLYNSFSIDYLLEIKNNNRKVRKYKNIKGPKKRMECDRKRLLLKIEDLVRGEVDG